MMKTDRVDTGAGSNLQNFGEGEQKTQIAALWASEKAVHLSLKQVMSDPEEFGQVPLDITKNTKSPL